MKKPAKILEEAENITVIRTDRLGDMILTLPMCAALKDLYPQADVSIIARSYTKPLHENCPAVDRAFYVDEYNNGLEGIITENKFDAVFFPRPRFNEAFAFYKAHTRLRVGTAYRAYSLLFNHRVHDHRKTAGHHEAEYNTRLVESASGKRVLTQLVRPFTDPAEAAYVVDILKRYDISPEKGFMIIHPGSAGHSPEWPAENFGRAASIISEKYGLKVVVTGTGHESAQCDTAVSLVPGGINLYGKLNLKQMIALISMASLFISNATGVLHIAAALKIPAVGLFPNKVQISAARWAPYSGNSVTVSPPLSADEEQNDDMKRISPEDVSEAIKKLNLNL